MSGSLRERHLAFADAVLALSAEPTSPNVVRYLVASRDLPDGRPPNRKRSRGSLPASRVRQFSA
jgi:hypothetical protein